MLPKLKSKRICKWKLFWVCGLLNMNAICMSSVNWQRIHWFQCQNCFEWLGKWNETASYRSFFRFFNSGRVVKKIVVSHKNECISTVQYKQYKQAFGLYCKCTHILQSWKRAQGCCSWANMRGLGIISMLEDKINGGLPDNSPLFTNIFFFRVDFF